jgi:hypothetical protein
MQSSSCHWTRFSKRMSEVSPSGTPSPQTSSNENLTVYRGDKSDCHGIRPTHSRCGTTPCHAAPLTDFLRGEQQHSVREITSRFAVRFRMYCISRGIPQSDLDILSVQTPL